MTSSSWKRIIAHVDMDAFFASVEVLLNPELAGKPLIIGASPSKGKGRGVVSTASYEARVFGVHSAMPIARAWKLCPHGVYIKPQHNTYSHYSKQVFKILEDFTPQIQVVSVDEAFLDLTGSLHFYGDVETMGMAIKDRIYQDTGLRASVGMAPSKSVAKIASDFEKPDGLTIVEPGKVQEFLDPLALSKLWGVGKKTFASLEKMNLNTVKELREFPEELLTQRFGKMGPHLFRMARGIDTREVHKGDPIKSVSHETTFGVDQRDEELIVSTLLHLSEKVASRLRKYGFRGKTVQLKLRFDDFTTFTRNKTVREGIHLTDDIFAVSKELYVQFTAKTKAVRLIGVGVTQLVGSDVGQLSLFGGDERKEELEKIRDSLQNRFGKKALRHADTLMTDKRRSDDKKEK
ncbi:MAG: DNA polymerase IV [Calditrichia bacterium]